MSGLKTIVLALGVALWTTLPSLALGDLARNVANCSGSLSAMVEHAWLMQDPASDTLERDRDSFLAILEALGLEGDAGLLNLRIDAKAAMHGLLSRASFGTDPALADAAMRRAGAAVSSCRLMLLGG